jgi:ATP/maltotriose-dependent transcriptional regulator MalT
VELAKRNDANETAAIWQAYAALREAEFGNVNQARQAATSALTLAPGRDVQTIAALVLALVGNTVQARKLTDRLSGDSPLSTILQRYWLPTIRAEIEVSRGNAAHAIELLQATSPYELGVPLPFAPLYPAYARGQAYLSSGNGTAAAAEFQKFLDHRGLVANFPLGSLARLGLARAYAMQGDTAKAKAAYQDFLTLWKNADPDIPISIAAKAEYAKLQ